MRVLKKEENADLLDAKGGGDEERTTGGRRRPLRWIRCQRWVRYRGSLEELRESIDADE